MCTFFCDSYIQTHKKMCVCCFFNVNTCWIVWRPCLVLCLDRDLCLVRHVCLAGALGRALALSHDRVLCPFPVAVLALGLSLVHAHAHVHVRALCRVDCAPCRAHDHGHVLDFDHDLDLDRVPRHEAQPLARHHP